MVKRCKWAESNTLFYDYHDNEWGKPEFASQKLFEMLSLESAQSGLSWITILKKRDGYRQAFANFHPEIVARFGSEKVEQLLEDASIVRHRQKIESVIHNAKLIGEMESQGQSFSDLIWSFVDRKPIRDGRQPSETELSRCMSKTLKKLGFKFVGPTTCYSFMQAAGLVNDHEEDCDFRSLKY